MNTYWNAHWPSFSDIIAKCPLNDFLFTAKQIVTISKGMPKTSIINCNNNNNINACNDAPTGLRGM